MSIFSNVPTFYFYTTRIYDAPSQHKPFDFIAVVLVQLIAHKREQKKSNHAKVTFHVLLSVALIV